MSTSCPPLEEIVIVDKGSDVRRAIGPTGRVLHPVGLGCMGFAWAYPYRSTQPPTAVIDAALEAGAAHFDTSDMYGPFEGERILGEALRGRVREDVFVASKGGLVVVNGLDDIRRDGRPEHLLAACEGSLSHLGLDTLDLYYLHRVAEKIPVEESWGALADLVERGLVHALGVSEASLGELERLQAIHPVAAVQSELSVWSRERVGDVLPWCAANGAAFVAFAPLGRGYLTGELTRRADLDDRDFRARLPRFTDTAMTHNAAILQGVQQVAAKHGVSPGQVALAWVLSQGPHVHAIPGTTRTRHLHANLQSVTVALDDEDLSRLAALPEASGTRY